MKKDKLAMFGIVVIIAMAILAVFGPMLCPYSYDDADFMAILQGPSLKHWFGTDGLGRDIFVRTLYGARISLTIGFVAAVVNMVIGVLYGGIAGYLGGWVDLIMMRIVDILSGIPSLIYLILIMMFLGSTCAEYPAGHVSDLLDHDSQNGTRTDFHTERAGLRSGCQGVRSDQMADSDPSSDSEQHGKYHCNDDVPDSFQLFLKKHF